MGTQTTPNMNLVLANPAGTSNPEPGPQYAADNNNSFTIIDSHNHSPGSGVQITPSGLNINANLNFQNFSPYNVQSLVFSVPQSQAGLVTLYTNAQSGGGITDLFYNDGAGNVIALTKAGAVNAVIASLPGESYSGGTFTWKQGAGSTTPANFDIGSITIRPNTAGTTNGVVLNPPSGISSQYDIQLPTVPGSVTSILRIDTSGNMSSNLVPDNSTIQISSNQLQVVPGGITATQIADNTITAAQIVARANYLSSSSGNFSTTGSTTVFNIGSISFAGGNVLFTLQPDGSTNDSFFGETVVSGGVRLILTMDGSTTLGYWGLDPVSGTFLAPLPGPINVPGSIITAGDHTFILEAQAGSGNTLFLSYAKLSIYELI